MKTSSTFIRKKNGEEGITLLITLLLMGVLLGISVSILNITLKQYQLAGIAYASEIAFQAANAGLECILYHDFLTSEPFAVNSDGTRVSEENGIACMGVSSADIALPPDGDTVGNDGEEQKFRFDWDISRAGSPTVEVCSEISIYKFSSVDTALNVEVDGRNMRDFDGDNNFDDNEKCPAGSVCTVVQSRGYNVPCNQIPSSPRVVEREYTQVY